MREKAAARHHHRQRQRHQPVRVSFLSDCASSIPISKNIDSRLYYYLFSSTYPTCCLTDQCMRLASFSDFNSWLLSFGECRRYVSNNWFWLFASVCSEIGVSYCLTYSLSPLRGIIGRLVRWRSFSRGSDSKPLSSNAVGWKSASSQRWSETSIF